MDSNKLVNEPPTLSRHLMETLRGWSSLHGFTVVFMFLTAVSKGSSCEAPSSPMCFRRTADKSIYRCEWRYENTTGSDVTFDLYYDETQFGSSKTTSALINEKLLIKKRPVEIWVEAHVGNSSCASNRTSVVLQHTIKYEAPESVSMSWLKNNLSLSWTAAEKHPALAEIRFRRGERPAELWEKRTTKTISDTYTKNATVMNLLKDSVYQVQIRHRSTQAQNPLWSDWSPVVTVPAELEQKPEVNVITRLLNGTREVTLTWKPMPHAAAVRGLTYSLQDTQSSRGCPCLGNQRPHPNTTTEHTTYVSLSAVNISVTARNAAGCSPPAVIQVPTYIQPAADFKICDKTLLDQKLNKKTCLELYELQDGDSRPVNVIVLMAKKKRERDNIKDYVRYLYFEHRCDDDRPQTVKMCLFYKKEGAPLREPQDFTAFSETYSSANLSWKAIPVEEQQGFLTHYSLCSVKISSHDDTRECHNISASVMKHRLENLTPGAKYNISLAGVTRAGAGPEATKTVNTPEKPVNVLWSLGLFLFLFITTMCTFILKRIKNKIYPPVPTPVIPDFTTYQPESQEFLEGKVEEVHELTLLQQLHPEDGSVPEDPEEPTVLSGEWDHGSDEDLENHSGGSGMSGGTSDEGLNPGSTEEALRSSRDLEQMDNEIAMLIYRNGLVFDVKADSP